MVYDGVAGPAFDEIPGVPGEANMGGAFSDDGSHHAYVGRQGTQWVVMEDGKEIGRGAPFFQGSGNQTMAWVGFTPGGRRSPQIPDVLRRKARSRHSRPDATSVQS